MGVKKLNILYNGGLVGAEALCSMGRSIIIELAKYHNIKLDCNEIGGYWEKFFKPFKDKKEHNLYLLNGHVLHINTLISKGHKVIVPIVIYETNIPKEWVDTLNQPEVKLILTISEFCKQKILESGVNKPVEVIYLGLDDRFIKTDINPLQDDKVFRFLNVSAPHCLCKQDRKGLDVLLNAFKQEFGDNPNIKLILKINTIYADAWHRSKGGFNLNDYLLSLLPENTDISNIQIIENYLDIKVLNQLYNGVDCGVYSARSEGYGCCSAEMIKLGKPVICSGYSALNEFSDERLRIKCETKLFDDPHYGKVIFAEPDVNHLRQLMRQVYENIKEENEIAEKFAVTMKKFNWLDIGKKISTILKNLVYKGKD